MRLFCFDILFVLKYSPLVIKIKIATMPKIHKKNREKAVNFYRPQEISQELRKKIKINLHTVEIQKETNQIKVPQRELPDKSTPVKGHDDAALSSSLSPIVPPLNLNGTFTTINLREESIKEDSTISSNGSNNSMLNCVPQVNIDLKKFRSILRNNN